MISRDKTSEELELPEAYSVPAGKSFGIRERIGLKRGPHLSSVSLLVELLTGNLWKEPIELEELCLSSIRLRRKSSEGILSVWLSMLMLILSLFVLPIFVILLDSNPLSWLNLGIGALNDSLNLFAFSSTSIKLSFEGFRFDSVLVLRRSNSKDDKSLSP